MFFFFFQAEDGIRDKLVTGVQTCALPIFLLFWGILAAVLYFWGIAWIDAQGQRVRLRRLSAKTHFFFVGALLLLWAPRGIDQFRVVVPQQLQHPPAPQPQHPPANGSWRERTPKDAFSFTLDVVPSARSTG